MSARRGRVAGAAARVAELRGWRRAALAAGLGALAIVAQPPVFALPVLFLSFTGLVWLIDGCRTGWRAALTGWCFGLGHFVAGVYWIGEAFLVDAARFGWMIAPAILGLSAYLAVFPAAATLGGWLIARRGPGRVLALAAAWAAAEWLRGVVLTGFPWNPLGNVWIVAPWLLQTAALTGVFGLSLLTVVIAAAPATLADDHPRRLAMPVAAAVVLALMAGGGAVRLALSSPAVVAGVHLRLVQPAIDQKTKWQADRRAENFLLQLQLSARDAAGVTHVIWPEAAVPYILSREPAVREAIAGIVPPGGLLIAGATRVGPGTDPLIAFNSVQAVDETGQIVAFYDKHHLVPFGEYLPWRGPLSALGLSRLAPGAFDFEAGAGPLTLTLPGLPPVSPLVCYEAIFPAGVVDPAARPAWLLNVTNDGWFGRSAGPYQHFAAARMRAVEQGLPLVRAANTGISGVIDAYGGVRASLGLGRRGMLDAALPGALAATPFARFGHAILAVMIAVAGLAAWLLGRACGQTPRAAGPA